MHIADFKHEQLRVSAAPGEWVVLSLTQPWASALFTENKRIETRSWRTNYRGRLYIHAAKGFPRYAKEFFEEEVATGRFPRVPMPGMSGTLGCIIGHVDLIDIKPTKELLPTISAVEESYGDFGTGRFGWITAKPFLLEEPIPAKGQLGIWKFNPLQKAVV